MCGLPSYDVRLVQRDEAVVLLVHVDVFNDTVADQRPQVPHPLLHFPDMPLVEAQLQKRREEKRREEKRREGVEVSG